MLRIVSRRVLVARSVAASSTLLQHSSNGIRPVIRPRASTTSLQHIHASCLSTTTTHQWLPGSGARSTADVRQAFVDYFVKTAGHTHLPSASVIPPATDDSLLFTVAGMVQFKDSIIGGNGNGGSDNSNNNNNNKVVTVQKCVRAGGKTMCDIDEVGRSPRHHTFFEMLGNFGLCSAYWKREAIAYAWQFLTHDLGLAKERLLVTVHQADAEAAQIWKRHHNVDVFRCSDKDNLWKMALTQGAPVGQCSEIYYLKDHTALNKVTNPADDERCVELWNLVFIQHALARDISATAVVGPEDVQQLPHTTIDTGAGLERLCSVLQGVYRTIRVESASSVLNSM
jgi:alanyl-tRNA synthetase